MNQTVCRYPRCFLIIVMTGAFLISSEMPLLASPQQSGQTQSTPSSSDQSSSGQSVVAQPSSAEGNNKAQEADDPLPDAPQAQSTQPQSAQTQQQSAQTPSGAAGAKAANVKGAPVAQPVGAAVAPARQRGHRALLIKIGLLAGAGIAVGTVVALSEKSPTRPPGSTTSSTHP
jgi:hypothetical protein